MKLGIFFLAQQDTYKKNSEHLNHLKVPRNGKILQMYSEWCLQDTWFAFSLNFYLLWFSGKNIVNIQASPANIRKPAVDFPRPDLKNKFRPISNQMVKTKIMYQAEWLLANKHVNLLKINIFNYFSLLWDILYKLLPILFNKTAYTVLKLTIRQEEFCSNFLSKFWKLFIRALYFVMME